MRLKLPGAIKSLIENINTKEYRYFDLYQKIHFDNFDLYSREDNQATCLYISYLSKFSMHISIVLWLFYRVI